VRYACGQMNPARRQQILDECELAGRMQLPRLPDSVHAMGDQLSDTLLLKMIDAHELGLAEGKQEKQP